MRKGPVMSPASQISFFSSKKMSLRFEAGDGGYRGPFPPVGTTHTQYRVNVIKKESLQEMCAPCCSCNQDPVDRKELPFAYGVYAVRLD